MWNAGVAVKSKIPFYPHIFWFAWNTFHYGSWISVIERTGRSGFTPQLCFLHPGLRQVVGLFWASISFVYKPRYRDLYLTGFHQDWNEGTYGECLLNNRCSMFLPYLFPLLACLHHNWQPGPLSAKRHKIDLPKVYLWSRVFPLLL